MKIKRYTSATVISNTRIAPDVFLLRIKTPSIARTARPGQFVMVSSDPASSPAILPRPFSIHGSHSGILSILYQIKGIGTQKLAKTPPKSQIFLYGPLGHGFEIGLSKKQPLLVAGGMGLAPMPFLYTALARKGMRPILLYGCREKAQVIPSLGIEAILTTEDGSCGIKGLVTDQAEKILATRSDLQVFACGPWPMLAMMAEICRRYQTFCQVSLESRMACGLGACQGCVVRTVDGRYLSVCSDGPVFDSRIIDWHQEPTI